MMIVVLHVALHVSDLAGNNDGPARSDHAFVNTLVAAFDSLPSFFFNVFCDRVLA